MANLLIILCDTPFQSERVEHSLNIAEVALSKGHEVSFYLFMDGVYNLMTSQKGEAFRMRTISDRFQGLITKGARVTCCKLCMELRGVAESIVPKGVIVGGIAELSSEIDEADSVLSFTGGF